MTRFALLAALTVGTAFAGDAGWVDATDGGDPREALAACRGQATLAAANGRSVLNWDLVRSCMEADGWRASGDPLLAAKRSVNRWLSADGRVTGDAAVAAHHCRLGAVEADASGDPRVDRGAVDRCMADAGYSRVTRVELLAAVSRTDAAVAAASE